jgi:hypothetical protein
MAARYSSRLSCRKGPLSGNPRSKSKKAATFGYLRARVFAQRVRENLWLSATAPFLTAGGGLDRANAHWRSLFRSEYGIPKVAPVCGRIQRRSVVESGYGARRPLVIFDDPYCCGTSLITGPLGAGAAATGASGGWAAGLADLPLLPGGTKKNAAASTAIATMAPRIPAAFSDSIFLSL